MGDEIGSRLRVKGSWFFDERSDKVDDMVKGCYYWLWHLCNHRITPVLPHERFLKTR